MENISYIPILKTKRAEFSALTQLASQVKEKILPLLEIEPVPIDPDTEVPDKTYDEMLDGFGQKVAGACTAMPSIFLDGILIEEQFISTQDTYPIINAVNQVRAAGIRVIPVTSPTRTQNYRNAIDTLLQGEVCLRLTTVDLVNPQMISTYIQHLGLPPQQIDVVIDLRDMLTEESVNAGTIKIMALGLINNLQNVSDFRTVALASGSFPVDLSAIAVGIYSQQRLEWTLWQDLHTSGQLIRQMVYSDYGVQHPEYTRLATRFPSATASVRYTGDNDFWVFRGRVATRYGYEQYGAHSQAIIAHPEYPGANFCAGDQDIENYAQVYAAYQLNPLPSHKFGSPEVWRRIGQNHHITKVVYQLANLYGL
ncbi:beta family protein [Enterobacter cloacae complex sp. CARB60]|uniref:beta family protein n=1 Tax=Enterobacter cloacae complex sp. CARB60 TaxID=3119569 RepID=UPI002F42513B